MSSSGVQVPERLVRFRAPVDESLFQTLWLTLCAAGLILMSIFFVRQAAKRKNLLVDVVVSLLASALLGVGSMFLLLWFGVWL